MKKSTLFSLFVVFGVFALSGCTQEKNKALNNEIETKEVQNIQVQEKQMKSEEATTPNDQSLLKTYTLDEVAEHATKEDCWMVVDGNVTDATSFFGKHPGGDDKLLKGCGKDASEMFAQIKKHTPKGYEMIQTLKIGTLASENIAQ